MQTFKRSLTPLDWPRFQFYARRMKHLSFEQSKSFKIFSQNHELNSSIFQAIESWLELDYCDSPLLPKLGALMCKESFNAFPLSHMCMFLGPCLTELSLVVPDFTFGLEIFLAAVKSRCVSLSTLRIEDNEYTVCRMFAPAMSDIVCNLPCLREGLF